MPVVTNSGAKNKLHPYYVTGFADGEGNFQVGVVEKYNRITLDG
jgi:hypothetical protein